MKTKKIQIKNLKIGNKIKTVDIDNNITFKTVSDVWQSEVSRNDQRIVKFHDDINILCSKKHPFICMEKNILVEILPDDLTPSHQVITDEMNTDSICSVSENITENIKYVDITVEDSHTFFVSDGIDKKMVLTHNSQGGVRSGSATVFFQLWHLEIENLLVLKNNKGIQDNRVRQLDYAVQINNYLYKRLIDGKNITLFSPHDVKDMYDAFFGDQKLFAELYEKYEADVSIRKKVIPAKELFSLLMTERKETGRIYIFNVDNANNHGSFTVPIKQSNLCLEICEPTIPMGTKKIEIIEVEEIQLSNELEKLNHDNSIINYKIINSDYKETNEKIKIEITKDISECALCTLANINLGNVKNLDDLENICKNVVYGLDNLLSYQEYAVVAAENSTNKFRNLGIGITNLAYYLAKNGVKYSDHAAHKLIHETMEAIQYYCIKASIELAKSKGPCEALKDTKYGHGLMPIDWYNKNVDEIVKPKYNLDWEWLRGELNKYGIRNATLSCAMPAESGSRVFNATSGVDPVRSIITTKTNKSHISRQVVPEINRLKNKYDLLWEMKSMDGFIKAMAVLNKFLDMAVSTNLSYNPENYKNNEIPMSIMLKDILTSNKYGLKTLYYHQTKDGREHEEQKNIVNEDVDEKEKIECESCSI